MAHAIGCLGAGVTLSTLDTRGPKCRAVSVARKTRNQNRRIAIVEVRRQTGEPVKYRAIREGHLHHYRNAYWYSEVRYVLKEDGKRLTLSRK